MNAEMSRTSVILMLLVPIQMEVMYVLVKTVIWGMDIIAQVQNRIYYEPTINME